MIANNNYVGLAVILARMVDEVNKEHSTKMGDEPAVQVNLEYSPLPGLPMHADIKYSIELPDDEPKTQIRMIARRLIKKAVFLEDPTVDSENWEGAEIGHALFS